MLLDRLSEQGKITVIVEQPVCIYSKDSVSYSGCWDNATNSELDIDKVDDSYELYKVEKGDRIDLYIPRNAKCVLKKSGANVDCAVVYKNIECDLLFEDEPIDFYFSIVK